MSVTRVAHCNSYDRLYLLLITKQRIQAMGGNITVKEHVYRPTAELVSM